MDNQITGNLEWSESGLQLLQTFKQKIAKIGGNMATAILISKEQRKPIKRWIKPQTYEPKPWTESELKFLVENHKKMKNCEIAEHLKRNTRSIDCKICRINRK